MTILWWTLYILGALTAIITWFNLMALLGRLFKVIEEAGRQINPRSTWIS